ncbi:MAG TPA: flagellar protein export ATPase FliI [Deltaproteobacteria bacterium]|nr:flagellar protein export ATPase FliI [Deltaproteobacteria bacterium]
MFTARLKKTLNRAIDVVEKTQTTMVTGRITRVVGIVMEGVGVSARVGDICLIYPDGGEPLEAEVVGFSGEKILIMPFGDVRGIGAGSRISIVKKGATTGVGEGLLGRIIDGCGKAIDGKGNVEYEAEYPLYRNPPAPLDRRPIDTPLDVGIRAINALVTIGKGQRMGIFAGSGVGKSVLIGMMAKGTAADVNVIALIGERGREVKEFIERELGYEGLKNSVVVAATSDEPPLIRIRAAFVAQTIAEYFRDRGKDVLLVMDSLTRFAMAQREVGLASGEPPTTKGYPPSVFALLPKLLERPGALQKGGTITALYTILTEGDDVNDPVADAVRAILDGHIVLSRELATMGHFPAIDVLQSISRVMNNVVSAQHMQLATELKSILADYMKAKDLINIGAYKKGNDKRIDRAIDMIERINNFLRQNITEKVDFEDSLQLLYALFS